MCAKLIARLALQVGLLSYNGCRLQPGGHFHLRCSKHQLLTLRRNLEHPQSPRPKRIPLMATRPSLPLAHLLSP